MSFWDNYEGWLTPKRGRSPYKVIDDPEIIARKNKIRASLREEYIKRVFNPYRMAAGMGGTPFDPAMIRYNSVMRTQTQFFKMGPRFMTSTVCLLVIPFGLFIYLNERDRNQRIYLYRTGQIAYKDRSGKEVL